MSNKLQYHKLKKDIYYSIISISIKQSEELKYENKLRKTLFTFHYIIIKLFLFSTLLLGSNQRKLQANDSFIIVKTVGAGNISILSNEFFNKNNNSIEVQLNNNIMNNSYQYYLNCSENQTNLFKIIFDKALNSTSWMFSGCNNITEIDFSHFDSSKITEMDDMFLNCSSLISLDLSNFNIIDHIINTSIFRGCERLEYINLKNLEIIGPKIFPLSPNNSIICFENEVYINLTLNNIRMKVNCMKNNTFNKKIEGSLCYMNYSEVIHNKNICKVCGNDFYLENNTSDNIEAINCSYLNNVDIIETTMTENIASLYITELTEQTKQTALTEQTALTKQTALTEQTEQIHFDSMLEYLILKELNLSDINSGKDKQIPYEGYLISFTSTMNQKKNEKTDNITIDLGQCEENLRKDNNISMNDSLYILKIAKLETGIKIPKIEYEVYYLSDGINNIQKLNLSESCKDTKIEISIRVKLNNTIDKYDPKSDYYNNICSKVTSQFGTDISLEDRRNEFVDNNMFICEEMCDLVYFNKDTEKVKCSCDVKLNLPSLEDIKFDKNEFLHNFIDTNNFANLSVMKCYKIVMIFKELIHNYGFYFMSFIILFYFITLFIFRFKSYYNLKSDIAEIYSAIKITEKNKPKEEFSIKKEKIIKMSKKSKNISKYKKSQKEKQTLGNTIETDNGNINESVKKILKINKKAGNEKEKENL